MVGELDDRVRCHRIFEHGLLDQSLVVPEREGVLVRAETEDVLRRRVVGIEIGAGDRPSRTRHVVARLEVELRERAAVPRPVVGGAAEVPQAGGVELEVGHGIDGEADRLAPVQGLGATVEAEVTALEQEHRVPGTGERA